MYKAKIDLKYNSCLVTGGAGFIGSHICEEAVNQGKRVICLDNMVAGKEENIAGLRDKKNFTFFRADVTDLETIVPQFKEVDIVFHNAASKCTVCRQDPFLDLKVNTWGTWCVLEASRLAKVKKVIVASTGSVYGEARYLPQDEEHPVKPRSNYGVSKLAGERYAEVFKEYYGLDYSVIRYFHVYGPRQESAEWGGVIPIFIRRAWQDKPLTIFGDGSQVRSFTYVKDDVNANFLLANDSRANGQVYNAASGIKVTILELAGLVKELMGKTSLPVEFADWRSGDIKVFDINNSKIKELGLSFETDFRAGLQATIDWYKGYFKAQRI